MSLPSRERGLKFGRLGEYRYMNMSLPSRERGLKYHRSLPAAGFLYVAPFAGAWIEI